MMDHFLEELTSSPMQFGGFKGSGTVYLLAELLTESMEALDDDRAASTLISLDLSKAFNRMNHNQFIQEFANQGASNQSIYMAASFLRGRNMKIKLPGGLFSITRETPGGSPQGTKSGNFFFCVAARGLSTLNESDPDQPTLPPGTEEVTSPPASLPTSEPPGTPFSDTDSSWPSSPLGGTPHDRRLKTKQLPWYSSES